MYIYTCQHPTYYYQVNYYLTSIAATRYSNIISTL